MICRNNYQLTRDFLAYQREVRQLSPDSVDRYRSYLKHLLVWANEMPLRRAAAIRPTFAAYVLSMSDAKAGRDPIAPVTAKKILQLSKRLLIWAKAIYPHDFREVSSVWLDALRLPHDRAQVEEHKFVKMDEVLSLIRLPARVENLAMQRDQAAAAMLFLSGARASAFGSFTLECIDLSNRSVRQWTSLGVKTKNGKSATTFLLDIPELLNAALNWDRYVRSRLPSNALWYTPIKSQWAEHKLSTDAAGAYRNIALARRIRKLFSLAELEYKSPHAFRHGHAVFALQHCRTMADYKAVSMNLMHSNITVTDGIYAPLASDEVQQRVAALTSRKSAQLAASIANPTAADELTNEELAAALMVAARRLAL